MYKTYYTTAMCPQGKIIEKRFQMIQKARKIKACVSVFSVFLAFVILSASVFASGILQNAAYDEYSVAVFNGKEKLEFVNQPYVENGTVYFPLREIIEKFDIMQQEESSIAWEDGKISLVLADPTDAYITGATPEEAGNKVIALLYYYKLEIGSTQVLQNPDVSSVKEMEHVPELKNGVTYVPFDFIKIVNTDSRLFTGLSYTVYDKNGEIVQGMSIPRAEAGTVEWKDEAGGIHPLEGTQSYQIDNYEKTPSNTINRFFESFGVSDFTGMKQYCTADCVENFFGDSYVFGMECAQLLTLRFENGTIELEDAVIAEVTAEIKASPNAVFGNLPKLSFYMILREQPDGGYLIDEFASGL